MQDRKKSLRILLTGGNGFLGQHLLQNEFFHNALAIGRTQPPNHCHFRKVLFNQEKKIDEALSDIDVIVHAAGRAHIMNDTAKDPLDEFRKVNTEVTLKLAEQAAISGIKRFIFISTIKVLGEETKPGQSFRFDNPYNPKDPYSISKVEAEDGLKAISEKYSMEIVIIRPPLIYGKGAKGNFAAILKLLKFKVPLPIGAIKNKRSYVSVDNLVDLIAVCLDHPEAKNQIFLVSDNEDMATPELFFRLAKAGSIKPYIFKFPQVLMYWLFRLSGKLSFYDRLTSSMQVNIDHTILKLNWKPLFTVNSSLNKCWQSKNN